jgi:hypothetical protein
MKTRPLTLPYIFALALVAALSFVSTRASAQMSDTEKKAAARAAYQEGVKLQDDGKFADALARFESAQKLFDAPTHLLHIAECQALTGRLVEASETYETLTHKTLAPGAPDAFTQAQQQGQAELPALRARIPSLRVTVKPGPQQVQNLQVNVNGVNMPNELLGIARPLNPGTYRFSAQAVGWSTTSSIDVPLGEKEQKSVELTMQQVAGGGAVVVAPPPGGRPIAPPPPAYGAPANPERPKPAPAAGPTSAGLLLGLHGGALVPTGEVVNGRKAADFASVGGGGGLDAYVRLAKMLLIGAKFDYASLGAPKTSSSLPANTNFDVTTSTSYFGINLGIVPNIDKVSFIGDIGVGSRTASQKVSQSGTTITDGSLTGLEFELGAGVSIPAGPIRIVPKTAIGLGSFSSSKNNLTSVAFGNTSGDIASADRGTHAFIFLGVAAFYSLDFGSKPSE